MALNLAIDIGNTRTKAGLFEKDRLVEKMSGENRHPEKWMTWLTNQKAGNVILSTVAGSVGEELEAWLRTRPYYLRLSSDTPLPVRNRYRTPETLGKDRLAAAAGAWALFPGENCLVIDAGTCITFDVITAAGEYLGGNISPGVNMRLRAMNAFTAGLPLVERRAPVSFLGDSTETALQNGGQWGAILEAEGYVDRCSDEFGAIRSILTGGDADFFVKNMKREIFANPDLVLVGLNKILSYNVERSV